MPERVSAPARPNKLVQRLPVRVRRVHGESVGSYIQRLASANGLDVREVAEWSKRAFDVSHDRNADTWWRVWADLSGGRIVEPAAETLRNYHRERPICLRCSHGVSATGPQPTVGMICLRHARWIDRHDGATASPADVAAERKFRKTLAAALTSTTNDHVADHGTVDIQRILHRLAIQ